MTRFIVKLPNGMLPEKNTGPVFVNKQPTSRKLLFFVHVAFLAVAGAKSPSLHWKRVSTLQGWLVPKYQNHSLWLPYPAAIAFVLVAVCPMVATGNLLGFWKPQQDIIVTTSLWLWTSQIHTENFDPLCVICSISATQASLVPGLWNQSLGKLAGSPWGKCVW